MSAFDLKADVNRHRLECWLPIKIKLGKVPRDENHRSLSIHGLAICHYRPVTAERIALFSQ